MLPMAAATAGTDCFKPLRVTKLAQPRAPIVMSMLAAIEKVAVLVRAKA